MRIVVFFDLPSVSSKDLREYRKFRKHLISSGFIMLQESVYSKIALNATSSKIIIDNLEKNKPYDGSIMVLQVTENQFQNIVYLLGSKNEKYVDSSERVVIL
ncbi:CRISPR-associated endonuclease Cas2 [Oceanivirga miroungae]|nr:CRISPR-associated endonuclease Cas2 [Oceanivirga miroungae]